MSPTLAGAFGIAALFVAALALVFSIQALRALRNPAATAQQVVTKLEPQEHPTPAPEAKPGTVKSELRRLGRELDTVQLNLSDALQHLAMVRYDAFGDKGGRLSWSMALLDGNGNGVVLTAINARSDARTYAKEIRAFVSEAKLSLEEADVIDTLRRRSSPPQGDADNQ